MTGRNEPEATADACRELAADVEDFREDAEQDAWEREIDAFLRSLYDRTAE